MWDVVESGYSRGDGTLDVEAGARMGKLGKCSWGASRQEDIFGSIHGVRENVNRKERMIREWTRPLLHELRKCADQGDVRG